MRTLLAVLIAVVVISATISKLDPGTTRVPMVEAATIRLASVRGDLTIERPPGAVEGAKGSVFVASHDGVLLRRVAIEYGSASGPLIQISHGVSAGDRVAVSDMSAWDRFDALRMK